MVLENKNLNLVLSSDAKPRLKWTPQLHQRFVDAVNQLGGSYKATPKSLMKVMEIHGLTLYHLKSHLQKYRQGKSEQSETCNEIMQEEEERESQSNNLSDEATQEIQSQSNEGLEIAKSLDVQMEVQRKLYQQIEVQRHFQLRIEAQGKYLQSVLQKAQETLSTYNVSNHGVKFVKEQLSQLASMVDLGCVSSLSALTELESSILKNNGSLESSLTSSETSRNNDVQSFDENVDNNHDELKNNSTIILPLMEMEPGLKNGMNNPKGQEKRNRNRNNEVEETLTKRLKFDEIDLNRKCLDDHDLDSNVLDLNCNGVGKFNALL